MYKVFINDRVFLIGFNLKKSFFDKKILFVNCYFLEDFEKTLENNKITKQVIVNFPTLRVMEKIISKRFRIVEAGGGLVVNKNKGKECLKKTYWFIMKYEGDEELVPQLEEDITKAKWMGVDKFDKVFENTFPSVADVLNAYLERK